MTRKALPEARPTAGCSPFRSVLLWPGSPGTPDLTLTFPSNTQ